MTVTGNEYDEANHLWEYTFVMNGGGTTTDVQQQSESRMTLMAGYSDAGRIVTRELVRRYEYSHRKDSSVAGGGGGTVRDGDVISISVRARGQEDTVVQVNWQLGDLTVFDVSKMSSYSAGVVRSKTITGEQVGIREGTEVESGPGSVSTIKTSVDTGPISKTFSDYEHYMQNGFFQDADDIPVFLMISPQVMHVVYWDKVANAYYQGHVITLGEATSPWRSTPSAISEKLYVSWCPVRDQLLVTDTPSSWV
jgi:hypothetical protein